MSPLTLQVNSQGNYFFHVVIDVEERYLPCISTNVLLSFRQSRRLSFQPVRVRRSGIAKKIADQPMRFTAFLHHLRSVSGSALTVLPARKR
jgi:hypothetical protein